MRRDTTVAVIIASYGDAKWANLAMERALPSLRQQGADEAIVLHQPDGDIATCRNSAAADAQSETLIFLDADDELQPGYVQAIRNAHRGPAMYTPRVSYVHKGRAAPPKFWPEKPLSQGNWLVIGTAVPREQFLEVGGFRSAHLAYEDWQLFATLWKHGLQPVKVNQAVYVAHVLPKSRNKGRTHNENVRIHYEIGRELFPDEYPPEWLHRNLKGR